MQSTVADLVHAEACTASRPREGATFRNPAPRRARRAPVARWVMLLAMLSAAVLVTACGGGSDVEACPEGSAIVRGECQAPTMRTPPAPTRAGSI